MPSLKTLLLGALALAALFFFVKETTLKDTALSYIENGEVLTFEAKYKPEEILQSQEKELLGKTFFGKDKRVFKEATLTLYPFLLMDVKYTLDKKTKEGILLWSLVEGEMVIDADSFEMSHGFQDAIQVNASRNDFKIMNALAKAKGGVLCKEGLCQELSTEEELVDPWIESAKRKKLIVQKGADIKLHFENPNLFLFPETRIPHNFVTKPFAATQKISPRYSSSQIERTAKAAFGDDFTIRKSTIIYVPVYKFEVANPDGSIATTYWNALTGKKIVVPLV